MPGESFAPIVVPAPVWERKDVLQVLRNRDVASLLRLVQQHTGVSQQRLATALEMSQGRVNELINRRRRVTSLGSFERLADGLRMPDNARMALGLAPVESNPMMLTDLAEITTTYPSQADAADEIRALAKVAETVDVMAVRGLGLLGLNDSLLRELISPDARLRVLLLDPDSDAAAYRANEIGESSESFAAGIRLSIARLRELASAGRAIELYTYDQVPVWRIIKLDDTFFVSAFTVQQEAHSCPTHRIEPNARGVLHHAFARTVEQAAVTARRII
jgi:transcriptional regulator with XRE-family HTH domain